MRWSRAQRPAQDGSAMLTALFVTMIVLGLVTVTVSYVINTLPQTRNHEDWNAAFAAAEAGVDDVIARLNQNPVYWQASDPDNPARDGWRELASETGRASYHYHLDATELQVAGFVDVTSTGRVGDQTRTVEARLRREGFLDYVYFTDIESPDPFLRYPAVNNPEHLDIACRVYRPDRNVSWGNNCGSLAFPGLDVIDGPLRTNDNILVRADQNHTVEGSIFRGPLFFGPVIVGSAESNGDLYRRAGSNHPTFFEGIRLEPRLPLPETAGAIEDAAAGSGCTYSGPTYLRLDGDELRVISPLTDPTQIPPVCGTGTPDNGVDATIDVPDRGAIFVRNSTRDDVSDHPLGLPHHRDDVSSFDDTAGDAFVYGELSGQLTIGTHNNIYVIHDLLLADDSFSSDDLIGLVAEQHVFVYHPVGTLPNFPERNNYHHDDAVNLEVFGRNEAPFDLDPGSPLPATATRWYQPTIHAAILALNRSFAVQNHAFGPRFSLFDARNDGDHRVEDEPGVLRVRGNIAQQFRGSVGAGTDHTGYDKDYRYDQRLQFMTPPYFLEPQRSPWGVRQLSDIATPPTCDVAQGEEPRIHRCVPPT